MKEYDAWAEAARIAPAFPAVFVFIAVIIIELVFISKKKIDYGPERKIQKAKELGQVVTAQLDSKKSQQNINWGNPKGEKRGENLAARYVYSIDGVHKKHKVISVYTCERTCIFPDTINIYYLGNKIYTDYDNPSPLPMFVLLGIPLVAAILVLLLTAPELI